MPNRHKKNGMRYRSSAPWGEQMEPQTSDRLPSARARISTALAGGADTLPRMRRFMLDHPGAFLATALALGIFVGWLIKRR
jgi:hypothetical protein